MSIFFTSDLHFFHKNIIQYSNRPVKDVEEMNELLINRWNEKVGWADECYFLGDLTFAKNLAPMHDILSSLHGKKYWLRGNHDYSKVIKELGHHFEWVKDYYELKDGSRKIVMCHFPFHSWNGVHHASWHLHGHCHGTLPSLGKRLDVGIDNHPNFEIFSYEEVKDYMDAQPQFVADGHVDRNL